MMGLSPQVISGSGNWEQLGTNAANGAFPGFGINNTAGVTLNQNMAIQNTLLLCNGALGGSGVITLGTGMSGLTTYVNNGVLNMTNPIQFNIQNITYNVNYNASTAVGIYTITTNSTITTGTSYHPVLIHTILQEQ